MIYYICQYHYRCYFLQCLLANYELIVSLFIILLLLFFNILYGYITDIYNMIINCYQLLLLYHIVLCYI